MQLISFCVNTARNELNHIQLLFKSFQQNLSTLDHEFIVFIDSDNQNTFDWLLTQKQTFPNLKILKNELPIPYGYARNINEMFSFASNEIVTYLQSDMVVCKNYDLEILKHLQPNMILCSTRIEPPLHGNSGEKLTYDFGLDPTKFDLDKFTEYAESHKQTKITEYFFAPFTLYKDTWNLIGGHDTRFRRSREDSDILIRLQLNGTKIIQSWNALVYHFTCTSSRGKDWFDTNNTQAQERVQMQNYADSIELSRFFRKWGTFTHDIKTSFKYNISAKIRGKETTQNSLKFKAVEPFFNKIQISSYFIDSLKQENSQQHNVANTLLNISNEIWSEYSYMYLHDDYYTRCTTNDVTDDIVVEFDLDSLTDINFIANLQAIIHQTEDIGSFSYGNFSIHIQNKNDVSKQNIIVKNPEIKQEHLYTVH